MLNTLSIVYSINKCSREKKWSPTKFTMHTQSMHIAQHSCVLMLRKVISAASSPVYEALVSIHLSSPHRFLLDAATNR